MSRRKSLLAWLQRRLNHRFFALASVNGWRIEGPFDSSYSLAIANREIALALAKLGESIALESRDGPGPFPPNPSFLAENPQLAAMWERGRSGQTQEITLRNTYPPFVDDMKGAMRGLVCYAWEESGFPPDYVDAFNANLSFIAVVSRFVAKVLRDNGVHIPICVVGNGIDQMTRLTHADACTDVQQKYDLDDSFCFLHISTCLPRKAVDVLLKAWTRAFTCEDNVVLVIKASANQHHHIEDDVAALAGEHPWHARIVLINEHLAAADVYALYLRAEVVVCPSRGEGFGLPLAEALALGKPVIATAYGGQMDFCTPENSWLCDYDFAYARSHVSTPDSVWAEPRLQSLINCLRQACSAPAIERTRRGALGRTAVRAKFAWMHVAERLRSAVSDVKLLQCANLPLPKLGWISPWNARCAVAEYSRALVSSIPEERLVVFGNQDVALIKPDQAFVRRCWEQDGSRSVEELYSAIRAARVDAIVIQFDFGLFTLEALARLIDRTTGDGMAVCVFLHSTVGDERQGAMQLGDVRSSLQRAQRLLVHSVHDLNCLKQLGMVENATLFPFGVPAPAQQANTADPARREQVIATFGFMLPHKGLTQLIEAFALLRRDLPNAHLLMLNSLVSGHESEREACEQAIRAKGLHGQVTLRTDYLVEQDVIERLAAADLVVYPYQRNRGSASAAVRLGLASLKPVATTPLAMFDDVASVAHRLPGTQPLDLAAGMRELLAQPPRLGRYWQEQRRWVEAHSWRRLSQRLDSLIRGEFMEISHTQKIY